MIRASASALVSGCVLLIWCMRLVLLAYVFVRSLHKGHGLLVMYVFVFWLLLGVPGSGDLDMGWCLYLSVVGVRAMEWMRFIVSVRVELVQFE